MDATDSIVQDVREMWSHKGVEVESQSGNKIRVRMPPYFQSLNEFVTSLESLHNCDVDLEWSTNNGTAGVILTIFAGQPVHDHSARYARVSSEHGGSGWSLSSLAWSLTLFLVLVFQVIIVASEWTRIRALFGANVTG
jgi:hypothetical protein